MAMVAGTVKFPPPFVAAPSRSSESRSFTVAATPKKVSSSSTSGRIDSKNRRRNNASLTTTRRDQLPEEQTIDEITTEASDSSSVSIDDGFVMPDLPGEEPDFWEGPKWDGLGFFIEYMWAFGIFFALIACGIAVATYNDGATDFKKTPAYQESLQTRELLEAPEASDSEVFESNPTEQAPPLE